MGFNSGFKGLIQFVQAIWLFEGTLLVAQLVEALRYKSEGCGFDSLWCHWKFSLT